MKFKRLGTRKEVDNVVEHIMNYLIENPNGKIYISTDSQIHTKSHSRFATVIVLANGKGCQVLYYTEMKKNIGANRNQMIINRLRHEIQLTANITMFIKNEIGVENIESIDLDFNEDPYHMSNKVFLEAVGWIKGLGVPIEFKTADRSKRKVMATYAADTICKNESLYRTEIRNLGVA